jgi:tRNA threonylcarbamoyladenosine biosynthesis protein TsaB
MMDRTRSATHLLAVDTATAWQSVALLQEERVLALVEQDAEGSHARRLMGAIDRVLKDAGRSLQELQGLALSIGPGSFTGLRVGLATLLGFRSVMGTPVVPVPTLEAMAWNLRTVPGRLVPVLKSRKNEVYWAVYEWLPGTGLHCHLSAQVGPPSSVAQALHGKEVCTFFGDGWQAYGQEIRQVVEAAGGKPQAVASELQRPSAVSVALAARLRLARGEAAGHSLVPLYGQRTEAEVKFDERQGLSAVERRRQRVAGKRERSRRPADRGGAASRSGA